MSFSSRPSRCAPGRPGALFQVRRAHLALSTSQSVSQFARVCPQNRSRTHSAFECAATASGLHTPLDVDAGWHYGHVPGFDVVQDVRVLLNPDLDPSSEDRPRRHRKPPDVLAIERLPLTIDTKPPPAIADLDLGPWLRLEERRGRNVPESLKRPPISSANGFGPDCHLGTVLATGRQTSNGLSEN